MDDVNVTIVGGGIVGLAIGAALAEQHKGVFIIEKNWRIGLESSTHNSGVIHSGIHYPPGSLKGRLCVRGNSLLYDICEKNGIGFKRTGKITVASSNDYKELEILRKQGEGNGVKGMVMLDSEGISRLEPLVSADSALYTPTSGIINQDELIDYYYSKFINNGGVLITESAVKEIKKENVGYKISGERRGGAFSFSSKTVINSAGLYADKVAEAAGIDVESRGYRIKYCKGDYYRIDGNGPVSMLVYPVPGNEGLGIHLTPGMDGTVRLGPNTYYVNEINYRVETDADEFRNDVARYVPSIRKYKLTPDFAGIRAKLQGRGEGFRDFVIEEESKYGLEGFINLIGIESPGLTASPAIAEFVSEMYSKIV
ncbi:MAG: NAD(P)/FAD-dependent oxidoreductase [Thermoplasmatales archaeon]